MAGVFLNRLLSLAGIDTAPEEPVNDDEYYRGEGGGDGYGYGGYGDGYGGDYGDSGYEEEDPEPDGGTLNQRFRSNRGGGFSDSRGGAAYGGSSRSGGSGPSDGRGGYRGGSNNNSNNIVSLHPQKTPENYVLVSSKPDRLEDAQMVCDHLKERHVIIVNIENLEQREAQRIVDFIGGAVFVLDGEIVDIASRIFAVVPHNVDIFAIKSDPKSRGFLSFGSGNSRNRQESSRNW
ncbi:MAG: cell division protein SepF [Clostridiales bacterium]|jgi:FtsZ-interacting cell division protein YlmF|nr:cell division protein SepF [Clostridiales bacterium]